MANLTPAERVARYRQRHPERAAEANRRNARRWAKANPDKVRARAQRRRDENPEYHRAHSRNSAQRRRAAGELDMEWAEVLRTDPCSYCGAQGGTLEHIVSVASGGSNDNDNLAGACRKCNRDKWTTSLLFFMLEGGGVSD